MDVSVAKETQLCIFPVEFRPQRHLCREAVRFPDKQVRNLRKFALSASVPLIFGPFDVFCIPACLLLTCLTVELANAPITFI